MFKFGYIFNHRADVDDRLDYIYDIIDDWMLAGKFDKCDEVLKKLQDSYLDMIEDHQDIIIGVLTITAPGKPNFKNRDGFAKAVYDKLLDQLGKDEADALTSGLL